MKDEVGEGLSLGKDAKEQGWSDGKGGVKKGKECRKRGRRKCMIEGRGAGVFELWEEAVRNRNRRVMMRRKWKSRKVRRLERWEMLEE